MPGVLAASVNLPAQRVRIEFERERTSIEKLRERLSELGYLPSVSGRGYVPDEHQHGREDQSSRWYIRNKEFCLSLTSGALTAIAVAGESWHLFPHWIAVGLYVFAYIFGGFDLFGHLLPGLRKRQFHYDIDLLMLLAALGAAALGEWGEGAFLLFLFSMAHAMEHYALGRARNAIRALSDLAPPRALVLRDGKELEVPVEEVRIGETVIVHPAQRIPVDGTVHSGQSAVDQAPITGESVPIHKTPGDEVFAGTVNGSGALEIVTSRASGDRTLDRVVQLVEEAQTQKAPTQRFTDKFERIFVPCVLIALVLLLVVPPLLTVWSWDTSFYRAMVLLVAASPCALALGTRSVVLAGIAQAARKGVLIKGGTHLEALGGIQAIAFDKTGTLTAGKPQVTELQDRGRSVMVVRHDKQWLGVIGLADTPRANARQTLNRLRDLGIDRLVMLTGDNNGVAAAIGREVGIHAIRAGLLPEEKVTAVQELLQLYGHVVMVGDGVNDAPALANATVGIAMGGAGTAAALETADVALMGDDLSKLPFAIGLSRAARRIIRWALGNGRVFKYRSVQSAAFA